MAILPVQPQQAQPLPPKSKIQESDAPRKTEETAQPPASAVDRVHFQGRVGEVETGKIVTDRVLERVEIETSAAQGARAARDLFAAAGKAEFQAAAPQTTGQVSPEAAANRIVEGITGYIFNAFQSRNSEPAPEDIRNFREQVVAGFEAGLEDARDILTGLQAATPEVEDSVNQTEVIVRERLDAFFEDLLAAASEPASAGTGPVESLQAG